MKKAVPYNTKWIVDLLKKQHPKEVEVIANLAACKAGYWRSKAYIYFVSAVKPNQPGSAWQHKNNIILEDEKEGTIVIDVLKDNKIGGIEFVKYIGE